VSSSNDSDNPVAGLSELEVALLGLLSIRPMTGSEALASWLGSTINVPEMRHRMMMRLFLGNLLPIEETSRLLTGYRDRMAARAESYRQARSGSPAR